MEISKIEKPAITISIFLLTFLISLVLSFTDLIFKIKNLSTIAKFFINYLASLVGVTLCILLCNYELRDSSLLLIILYSVSYLIIKPLSLWISSKLKSD